MVNKQNAIKHMRGVR
jgi:hypothetical protein